MGQFTKAVLLGAGTLFAGWIAWGLYVRHSTEQVPYETARTVDGVEIREYPQTILVETTAPDQRTGFRRLFEYLQGANEGDNSVSMTAPVETQDSIDMTAPVETESDDDGLRMAFYLPMEYTPDTAPEPTDSAVKLRIEPSRTVAVRQFSWFTPDWRVKRQEKKLLTTLDPEGIEPLEEVSLLRYNDPRTPPFMRRNEVVVKVDTDGD